MRGRAQKSFTPSSKTMTRKWYVVDASDRILGRLATRVAMVLMGKHKPTYTTNLDTGDFVIVLNAAKVKVTGRKAETKIYQHFSGYPGGRKEVSYAKMMANRPEEVLSHAIKGMLPSTVMGRHMFRKLKVYRDGTHPHQAQCPLPLEVR